MLFILHAQSIRVLHLKNNKEERTCIGNIQVHSEKYIPKSETKSYTIRILENFDNILFRSKLRENLSRCTNYESFDTSYTQVLNRQAPIKKKTLRANQVPYYDKDIEESYYEKIQLRKKISKQ